MGPPISSRPSTWLWGSTPPSEAAHAYLDWLAVVTRDEIAALWPHVETVAQALVARTDFDRGGNQDPAGVAVMGEQVASAVNISALRCH